MTFHKQKIVCHGHTEIKQKLFDFLKEKYRILLFTRVLTTFEQPNSGLQDKIEN